MFPAIVSKSNPRGQKSLITLPDGSRVKLNAESYLEYPQDFAQSREIKLVGEAFFEVVRDTLHPFVVTSGEVQVRVLGTSFNVQAFPFEEDMTVAVASGAVMVEKKSQENGRQMSHLQPREMVKVNHKTGAFEKTSFDPDELLAWKDGMLVFYKASFDEIVQKLERWYGVDFIIRRDNPITEGFTGRYDNPSLEVVLEGMSFSSDFTFQIEGDKVIIE
jgi:ferric-dicitrate binding protein FerR (iron transport regulator)